MAARSVALPVPRARAGPGAGLAVGVSIAYLSAVGLLPRAALVWAAHAHGSWRAVTDPQSIAALKLTLVVSLVVAVVQAIAGTAVAWTLVRDRFLGQGLVNSVIDLPFALPTIVASLTLLTLYGPRSPVHVHAAFTRWALVIALLFVTLPFVVRTVQPVLLELDREMEDAAAALGASRFTTFRRIVLPNILPAILSGVALAFARAVGEFGSVVLVSGNIPFRTEVTSVYLLGRIESGDPAGAAAVSVVLLGLSFAVLLLIGGVRRYVTRHDG